MVQVKLQCWIYVSSKEYATRQAVMDALRAQERRLEHLADAGVFAGYHGVALVEPDDFEEDDIDRDLVESVTHGRLPAIYLNITYDLDLHRAGGPEIDSVLSDGGMTHVVTYPPAAG
jgi:hypothetical protein